MHEKVHLEVCRIHGPIINHNHKYLNNQYILFIIYCRIHDHDRSHLVCNSW